MAWTDIDKLEYGKDLRSSAVDNFNKTNSMIEQLNTDIKSLEETVSSFDAKISKIESLTTAVKEIGKNLTVNHLDFIMSFEIINLDSTTTSFTKECNFSQHYSFSDNRTPQIYKDLTNSTGYWYFLPISTTATIVETTDAEETELSNFDAFKNYRWNVSPSSTNRLGPVANTNFIVGKYTTSRSGSEKTGVTISGTYRFNVLAIKELTDTKASIMLNTTLMPWSIKNISAYYDIVKNL